MSARPTIFVAIGERFGRGVVTELGLRCYRKNNSYSRAARLRCDCGSEYVVALFDLRKGRTVSCGCDKAERTRALHTTHGLSGHPLFRTWDNMIRRCEKPHHPMYPHYGARGIAVCEGWHDPATFIADILTALGPRPDGMSLDRIDNDGNYEPGNVRWATRSQQGANQRARNGAHPPEWRARRQQVLKLYQQGVTSPAKIARQLGLPHRAVCNDVAWIRRHS